MDKALKNSTPGKVADIWRIERFQIDAIKFERTQLHIFFSDVDTAAVVVVAQGPFSLCSSTTLPPPTIQAYKSGSKTVRGSQWGGNFDS